MSKALKNYSNKTYGNLQRGLFIWKLISLFIIYSSCWVNLSVRLKYFLRLWDNVLNIHLRLLGCCFLSKKDLLPVFTDCSLGLACPWTWFRSGDRTIPMDSTNMTLVTRHLGLKLIFFAAIQSNIISTICHWNTLKLIYIFTKLLDIFLKFLSELHCFLFWSLPTYLYMYEVYITLSLIRVCFYLSLSSARPTWVFQNGRIFCVTHARGFKPRFRKTCKLK